jgi:hypothetical protein
MNWKKVTNHPNHPQGLSGPWGEFPIQLLQIAPPLTLAIHKRKIDFMTAIEVLQDLRRRGFEVEADGSDIFCRGTTEPLTPDLLDALKLHKPEIIKYLVSYDLELSGELSRSGLSPKWENYLLERIEILINHEGYPPELAREEVLKMIPYYRRLN